MRYELPYPPTMNTYWRHCNGRHFISAKGKKFREEVILSVMEQGRQVMLDTAIEIEISLWHPDHRRRDIDNTLKPLLDALEHAKVYRDDQQVARLAITRCGTTKGGRCVVNVKEMYE